MWSHQTKSWSFLRRVTCIHRDFRTYLNGSHLAVLCVLSISAFWCCRAGLLHSIWLHSKVEKMRVWECERSFWLCVKTLRMAKGLDMLNWCYVSNKRVLAKRGVLTDVLSVAGVFTQPKIIYEGRCSTLWYHCTTASGIRCSCSSRKSNGVTHLHSCLVDPVKKSHSHRFVYT